MPASALCVVLLPLLQPSCCAAARESPSRGGLVLAAGQSDQVAAGVDAGKITFDGWVPSDLRRFLPLAVFLTCLAEMVLLPTRFFLDSAMSFLSKKEAEDTCGTDACAGSCGVDRLEPCTRRANFWSGTWPLPVARARRLSATTAGAPRFKRWPWTCRSNAPCPTAHAFLSDPDADPFCLRALPLEAARCRVSSQPRTRHWVNSAL
jgi:hypothetical protein